MEKQQAVRHQTFGEGVVKEVRDDRVDVLFTIGLKTLLKEFVTAIEPTRTTKLLGCAGKPAKYQDTTAEAFVKHLLAIPYRLEVYVFSPQEHQRVRDEYRAWTRGEELPESAVRVYDRSEGCTFTREWRLTAPYSYDMPCSAPIIEGGSVGRGHKSDTPHGLHYGNIVGFYYSEMIEELVRAGLRVV